MFLYLLIVLWIFARLISLFSSPDPSDAIALSVAKVEFNTATTKIFTHITDTIAKPNIYRDYFNIVNKR
jgi:hypothetical protein